MQIVMGATYTKCKYKYYSVCVERKISNKCWVEIVKIAFVLQGWLFTLSVNSAG